MCIGRPSPPPLPEPRPTAPRPEQTAERCCGWIAKTETTGGRKRTPKAKN